MNIARHLCDVKVCIRGCLEDQPGNMRPMTQRVHASVFRITNEGFYSLDRCPRLATDALEPSRFFDFFAEPKHIPVVPFKAGVQYRNSDSSWLLRTTRALLYLMCDVSVTKSAQIGEEGGSTTCAPMKC